MPNRICFSFLVIAIFLVPQSHAWGRLGHRLTAAVAEEYLTDDARRGVEQILHHQSMIDVSDWADRIRPSRRYLTWHYATWPDVDSVHPAPHSKGQLYGAIQHCLRVLNPTAHHTNAERLTALKLLIHLVADAHQPLHIGNGKDVGGNRCLVRWFSRRKPVNFHKIWDTYLVKATLRQDPILVEESLHLQPRLITAWQNTPILEWLHESRRWHARIYPKNAHPFCQYRPKKLPFETLPHLGDAYVQRMMPIVKQRIWQGGVRLAHLLNQIAVRHPWMVSTHSIHDHQSPQQPTSIQPISSLP